MRKMMHRSVLAAAAACAGGAPASAVTWEIDPAHTSAVFAVKHLMVSTVRGTMKVVKGTIHVDEKDVSKSMVEAELDAASVDTRQPKRDGHLKSADFFDVESHPTVTFKSKSVEKVGEKLYKVTGNLTIRGNSKEVVLDVEGPTGEFKSPKGMVKTGATARTKINRKEFGLKWAGMMDEIPVAGDEVEIQIDIEADRVDGKAKK